MLKHSRFSLPASPIQCDGPLMAGADPTVFTHALHLLPPPPHSQENRPKGTSVLQLSVSDRDATHNGPPFHFAIVDGNEGDAFEISQQGALVAAAEEERSTRGWSTNRRRPGA